MQSAAPPPAGLSPAAASRAQPHDHLVSRARRDRRRDQGRQWRGHRRQAPAPCAGAGRTFCRSCLFAAHAQATEPDGDGVTGTATILERKPAASNAEPILLDVQDLHVHFETSRGKVRAVEGLSFNVRKGEIVAIVGESGSGKSVSALSIMRLLPRHTGRIPKGRVTFDGRDLLMLSEEQMRELRGRDISMIFQEPMTSLNPILTIGLQITEPLTIHLGMTDAQARARAVELLSLVGIPDPESRLDQYPHQFSGGMRQRVMIAIG